MASRASPAVYLLDLISYQNLLMFFRLNSLSSSRALSFPLPLPLTVASVSCLALEAFPSVLVHPFGLLGHFCYTWFVISYKWHCMLSYVFVGVSLLPSYIVSSICLCLLYILLSSAVSRKYNLKTYRYTLAVRVKI